jgi:hypothetical protein
MRELLTHLTDDGCASENANQPVENHEGPIDIVGRLRVLSYFCGSFHGKVEAA